VTCPSGSEVGRKGYSVGVVEAEDEVAGDPLHMAEVKEPLHQLEPRGVIPIYIAIIPLLSQYQYRRTACPAPHYYS
jgi:hypothetical protein